MIYNVVSLVAALTSIATALVALKALRRGLTYDAMYGMMVVLVFVAVGRIWHTTREVFVLAPWAELLEYVIYIVGNTWFHFLAMRVGKPLGPDAQFPQKNGDAAPRI